MTGRKSGVVMELAGKRAIVLTNNGQFERVRLRKAVAVGELIPLRNASQIFSSWRFRSAVAGITAAAVLFVCVLHACLISPTRAEAYAFVSLDVNPSISLNLSSGMNVLAASGLNAAGKQLVSGTNVRGKSLDDAIGEIVDGIVAKGMLPQNGSIVVAAACANANDVSSIQSRVVADVKKELKASGTSAISPANVYSLAVSDKVWNQALKKHVSPAKYETYLLARNLGLPIKLSDIHSTNLQQILSQVASLKSGVQQLQAGNASQVKTMLQHAEAAAKEKLNNTTTSRQHVAG